MKKWIKYILILLLGIIVGIIGFEILNKENDTLKIEVVELSYDDKIEMIRLGSISNVEYYIYSLKDIRFISDNNKQSLWSALEEEKITIDAILKEMSINDNCGGFIYSYEGEGKLGDDKFSILKKVDKYVFTTYNPNFPDEIFNEFCVLY